MESLTEKFAAGMDRIAADHNLVLREVAVAVSGGADSLALAFCCESMSKNTAVAR